MNSLAQALVRDSDDVGIIVHKARRSKWNKEHGHRIVIDPKPLRVDGRAFSRTSGGKP